jgi:cellulose synthase/poly-beta-1,6-N-acetylglucosamine synthase-like glycosyltransferase
LEILVYIYWIALFSLVYPYAIYPLFLRILTRFSNANKILSEISGGWPSVTFIVSAYNEEQVIERKLRNALEMEYSQGQLEIMVISDASSDRTDDIVRDWGSKHPHIRLVRQEQRRGKTSGLNQGVKAARGDIIIFSDANAMYRKDAIRELVKYFANSEVGYVVGAALYNKSRESEATESEDMYWNVELVMKDLESKFYSVVGGDGAIYAIRKELYWNLDEDDINDFVNPLQIVAAGYRGIFNPQAICYEDAAEEFRKEFRRKRRIVNRSWRAVKKTLGKFSLLKHLRFLFMLFSHKVIRWFSLVILGILLIANLLLVVFSASFLYWLSLAGLIFSVFLALLGAYLDGRGSSIPKLIYLPYYYYLVNLAAVLGIIDEFKGIRHTIWEHVRESGIRHTIWEHVRESEHS